MLDSKKISIREAEILLNTESSKISKGQKFGWNSSLYEISSLERDSATIRRISEFMTDNEVAKYKHDDGQFSELKYFNTQPGLYSNPNPDPGSATIYQQSEQSALSEGEVIKWLASEYGISENRAKSDFDNLSDSRRQYLKQEYTKFKRTSPTEAGSGTDMSPESTPGTTVMEKSTVFPQEVKAPRPAGPITNPEVSEQHALDRNLYGSLSRTGGTELWQTPQGKWWLLDTVTMNQRGNQYFDTKEGAINYAVQKGRWSEAGAERARKQSEPDGTAWPEDLSGDKLESQSSDVELFRNTDLEREADTNITIETLTVSDGSTVKFRELPELPEGGEMKLTKPKEGIKEPKKELKVEEKSNKMITPPVVKAAGIVFLRKEAEETREETSVCSKCSKKLKEWQGGYDQESNLLCQKCLEEVEELEELGSSKKNVSARSTYDPTDPEDDPLYEPTEMEKCNICDEERILSPGGVCHECTVKQEDAEELVEKESAEEDEPSKKEDTESGEPIYDYEFGDLVTLKEDPKMKGIFLKAQDGKPGDIDFIIYFLQPVYDKVHVVETCPVDIVKLEDEEASEDQLEEAKEALETYEEEKEEYEDDFEGKVEDIIDEEEQGEVKEELRAHLAAKAMISEVDFKPILRTVALEYSENPEGLSYRPFIEGHVDYIDEVIARSLAPNDLSVYSFNKPLLLHAAFEIIDLELQRIGRIVKTEGKWQVVSEGGKNMGKYDTKEEAVKRLRQVEFFKHQK